MTDKRIRTHSLPVSIPSEELSKLEIEEHVARIFEDEVDFEADDETSGSSSRRPSSVAKQEIDQARRLSEKLSTATRNSSPILLVNSTNNASQSSIKSSDSGGSQRSIVGSLYSLGGAVWSYIRGKKGCASKNDTLFLGPNDTNSTEDNSTNSLFRNRSKSFSASTSTTRILNRADDELESNYSDSSDAPDFSLPNKSASPAPLHARVTVEPGRGKIVFKAEREQLHVCNLIGRDFGDDEHILSSRDITTVNH